MNTDKVVEAVLSQAPAVAADLVRAQLVSSASFVLFGLTLGAVARALWMDGRGGEFAGERRFFSWVLLILASFVALVGAEQAATALLAPRAAAMGWLLERAK